MTNQNNFEQTDYGAYHSDRRNRAPLSGLPSIHSLEQHFSRSMELLPTPSLSEDSQTCSRRHLINLLERANETDYQGQRLSLSLGSQLPSHVLVQPHVNHIQHNRNETSYISSPSVSSSQNNRSCSTSYETEIFATVVGNSRFLNAAQTLLEEAVSVGGKSIDFNSDTSIAQLRRRRGALSISAQMQAELYNDALTPDVQTRINKLISLLDKLESKYEQYYHHMEELVSSFEVIAGLGSAKSYTALTLQAMSRHFYSLREAIITHIRLAKRQYSQDSPRHQSGNAQLAVFDQGARHNGVSLQQLGMVRNQRQTWRPTRGLPETSVGILRSWLFEHFLHPYPNDSEKLMLASQTGLTKNQVSNWFINARVRLWKPMIEEMYTEELGESSMDSNQSESISTTSKSASDHGDM
ncbi:Bel1-like homeodomain protein [Thalictrum thalictroides]|uniref:Bel1-like homeodomain protein n=1 Tax=Thalictrum thalictroides TaxID=46969 RepID=A0A7J6X2U8_THATH|nr:Bel1-like homeodomain protein [Thalictrum thalictroides]